MRKILNLLVASFLSCHILSAQVDSVSLAKMDAMLDGYVAAIEGESMEVKVNECSFLINSCTDSILRQRVATKLFDHYSDSRVMGEEAVAIAIYDEWIGSGKVRLASDDAQLKASIFVEFNRNTLTGMPSPVIDLELIDGGIATLGGPGERRRVLYFYDTECGKCRLESILLRSYLDMCESELDFYAVYVGSDRGAWNSYIGEKFKIDSDKIRVFHMWDPEGESDMYRLYGILQTPRMFYLDKDGTILGRRLTVEALQQLVTIGKIEDELLDRNPAGSRLPEMKLSGTMLTARGAKSKTLDISRLRGRPAYLMFFSEGCSNCQKEKEALPSVLKGKTKVFMVDVDAFMADDLERGRMLFDAFDLTTLPHIISLDRKGVVTDKYISFQ